ncbi:hypothetical protein DOY81_013734, partial [Sarcophaga bullata]
KKLFIVYVVLICICWARSRQQQLKQTNRLVLKVQEANQQLKIN